MFYRTSAIEYLSCCTASLAMNAETATATTQGKTELIVGRIGRPFLSVAAVVLIAITTFQYVLALRSVE